ncbi:TPM domain-containing protein [Mucilaginibacter sp. HMF5004]|nr:TPM domain-containing protein [Mucilaginibacter rivuli]
MFKKIIFTCTLILTCGILFAQEIPVKSGTLVTDFTNTLSLQDKTALENKLVAFNDSTSTQIAVVLMKSTGSYDIAQYAIALGRAWGIGQQGKNNGILVLAALEDRKVTIQTGYGAEGAVPDAITSQIIQQQIKPNFKQGNYYAGLDEATTSLMKYMKGEYKADEQAADKQNDSNGSGVGIIVFIVIIVLIMIFRKNNGGGGQIIGRRGSASPFWWFLAGSALGSSSRGDDGFGGGGFGGGSSGGGGGGFGGFGGGSFGGGGSSGSW